MSNHEIVKIIRSGFLFDEKCKTDPQELANVIYLAVLVTPELREEIIRRGTLAIANDIIGDLE